MNIFDFVTQEQLDELPEDNNIAFAEFVMHCQRRLDIHLEQYDENDQDDWKNIYDWRHSFVNIVLAAARRFEVEQFSMQSVPYREDFNSDVYTNFSSDLDHHITQLILDKNIRLRSDSTSLSTASKDRIRSHLHHLREIVAASDLDNTKKAILSKKIDEFDRALDKSKVRLLAVTRLAFEILAVPGAMWASYDVTNKLLTNIMQTVAEEKSAEDEQRKLPTQPKQYAIVPPRHENIGSENERDNDDEIPF